MHAPPRILWLDLGRERDVTLRRAVAGKFENFREVTAADSADYATQRVCTVIVCHLDPPTGPCLEILRHLRFSHPAVPMIAIVAERSNDLLRWFLQMRVWDVFFKPCPDEHLLRRIQEANHPDLFTKFAMPRDVDLPALHQWAPPMLIHAASNEGNGSKPIFGDSPAPLTPRETRVLALLRSGQNAKEIGRLLGISYETVRKHQKNVYRKLGVSSAVQAILHVR